MAAMKHSIVLLLAFGFGLPALSQDSSVVKTTERMGEEGGVFIYKETIYLKPPFYEGSVPLVYEAGRGGVMGGIVYWHKFDGWRNQFSYNDVMSLETIEARNSGGKLLAKAELVEVQTSMRRMIYRETHYGVQETVQFVCLSQYEAGGTGFKLKEDVVRGEKKREYFFLLPLSFAEGVARPR